MIGSDMNERDLELARKWIGESDYVLYTAGAGLTAAAGIDYTNTELFAREFPAMRQYGFEAQYQLIGFDNWTPDLQWGYWAAHVNLVRFRWPKSDVYKNLAALSRHTAPENMFVMTSNVDAMFARNGFEPERIYTPQGDYALLQCTTPCWRTVWQWKDQIDKIIGATDANTQRLTDLSLVPSCPNCGNSVFPNVRVDRSFVDDHFHEDAERLRAWLATAQIGCGVVIEVGAGFNTPSVIRWPGERIVESVQGWKLVRINRHQAEVPDSLVGRAIGLWGDAARIISTL